MRLGGPIRAAASARVMEAWPYLVAELDGPDEDIQRVAKEALEELKTYQELKRSLEGFGVEGKAGAIKEAQRLAASEDPAQRRGAAFALGALDDPAAVPPLLTLLKDADPSVREAAVQALQRLSAPRK